MFQRNWLPRLAQELKLVQDATRFKRWLKQQKVAQNDFEPLVFF